MSRRGFFLCVEGADGVGKSTIVRRLVEEKGWMGFASPNRSLPGTGELISKYLKGEVKFHANEKLDAVAAQMIFAANMFQQSASIEAALHEGKDVVIDRYVASAISYLSLHMEIKEADNVVGRFAEGLPCPDLTIVLDMDPKDAMNRADARGARERYDDVKMQERVREAFLHQCDGANAEYTCVVNAGEPRDAIFKFVSDFVDVRRVPTEELARYEYHRVVDE